MSGEMVILAQFITRDGFVRRERLPKLLPTYEFTRPQKMSLRITTIADLGLTTKKTRFYLAHKERGPGNIWYATYKED